MIITLNRLTNGTVVLVEGSGIRRFVNLSDIQVTANATHIRITNTNSNQSIADLKYADITTINGSAKPGTIDATAIAICETVFLTL